MTVANRTIAVLFPAAVFQSVIFGGAYGTGREVVEFISVNGPMGGLFAILQIAVAFSIVLTLSFEVARVFQAFDYRTFFIALIGRGWILFELLLVLSIPLVLAVNGSAAAAIFKDQLHMPVAVGTTITFVAVVILSYLGPRVVERSVALTAGGLVALLLITGTTVIGAGADDIRATLTTGESTGGWVTSALQYSLYNVAVIPIVLYAARDIRSAGESVVCALLAGAAAVFPALVLHISFMVSYPEILQQPLPVYSVLKDMASPAYFWAYIVILMLMIISTVLGLLHGLNERIDAWHVEVFGKPVAAATRATVAAFVMLISLALSGFGIVSLIAKGYGTLAWAFLAVFVLPLILRAPVLLRGMK